MTFSTDLITQLINYINKDGFLSKLGKAIRAYDTPGLSVPLRETYFSFSCKENTVTFIKGENSFSEKNKIVIKMNCFSPLKKSAYSAHSLTEQVTAGLREAFKSSVTDFTIGDTEYDDDIKCYKITALINFCFTS